MQVVLDRENRFSQRVCRACAGAQARALRGMHMGARAVVVATCGARLPYLTRDESFLWLHRLHDPWA